MEMNGWRSRSEHLGQKTFFIFFVTLLSLIPPPKKSLDDNFGDNSNESPLSLAKLDNQIERAKHTHTHSHTDLLMCIFNYVFSI